MTSKIAAQVASRFTYPQIPNAGDWVRKNYDTRREGQGDRGPSFMNYGYWYKNTLTTEQSSENLMEKLIASFKGRGNILDVACGYGGTTNYLCRYWKPSDITAVNFTETQIEYCRRHVPGVDFRVMDAAKLDFEPESFDNIVCVEAALHFETRRDFLKRAQQVLRKGGTLALTDLLLIDEAHKYASASPRANHVESPSAYREKVLSLGFSSCDVIDITEEGVNSHFRFQFSRIHDEWVNGRIDFDKLMSGLAPLYMTFPILGSNVMCFARK